jgi:aspartate ammonia-lyase
MEFRIEHDLLGELQVPENVYWGIHTQRALTNFNISSYTVPGILIRAIAKVKHACCETNRELGHLDTECASAIISAASEIESGGLLDQFPLDAMQGGAGTSTNMNLNEVIANRALEIMGHNKGEYNYCHPIEHVNLHQSTNDVYPTAVKIACIESVRALSEAIAQLQGVLQKKEKEFAEYIIIGRTELQDAVPMTLGAQFSSFAEAISRDRWRTFKCEERLRLVNLGGTAIGTGLTAPRRYIFLVNEKIRMLTGYGLTRGENLVDQTANTDVFVEVSGILDAHSANLIKICNDLRLLHMLDEIRLVPVQAGSSIMPGKVNPVILESVISTAMKVSANHTLITNAVSRGSLQINEFLPLIAFALLESISFLTNASKMAASHLNGCTAGADRCTLNVNSSTAFATALVPHIGYKKAEALVDTFCKAGGTDFRMFLSEQLGEELINSTLSPRALMSLGYRSKVNGEKEGRGKKED